MGRPPQINRDAVVAAALAVADERGIDGVTMAAVAERLGVTPMALYRHVRDKADLLDQVVEALLTEFRLPAADGPPGERLQAVGRAVRAVARRHPTVFPLLLQRPATTPASRRARDAVCAALVDVGVPEADAPRVERLVSTAVLGFAASEVGGRFRNHSRRVLDEDFARLEAMIEQFIAAAAGAGRAGRQPKRAQAGAAVTTTESQPSRRSTRARPSRRPAPTAEGARPLPVASQPSK